MGYIWECSHYRRLGIGENTFAMQEMSLCLYMGMLLLQKASS